MIKQHQHLIVHAFIDNPPKSEDCEKIAKWMEHLVHSIGMQVLRPATAMYCDQEGNRGMTADVLLTTSHMVLHTWDEDQPSYLEFDLYTCSSMDVNIVIDEITKMFAAKNVSYKFLDRYAGLRTISES